MAGSNQALNLKIVSGLNMKPALLHSTEAMEIPMLLQELADVDPKISHQANLETLAATFGSNRDTSKDFIYQDGLAYIPITGMLINRFPWAIGWITGYEAIHRMLNAALEDDDVKGIVFDVHSGGGFVAGCFELADVIYASREVKPSVAVVNTASYSAAFALASSASKVVVAPSGGTGSVGVVVSHINIGKALENFGVEVTLLHAGEHKVDGNPYESLSPAVKADIQASIDKVRGKFVATVARNLGLDEKVVYDTEAQVYDADESVALGFAHSMATVEDALLSFHAEVHGTTLSMEKTEMTDFTKAQYDAGVAEASTKGKAEGAKAERERVKAIVTSDEATGREDQANYFAFETDLPPEAAVGALSKAPKAEAKNKFEQTMDTIDHPEIKAEDAEKGKKAELTPAERIALSQDAVNGTDNAKRIKSAA